MTKPWVEVEAVPSALDPAAVDVYVQVNTARGPCWLTLDGGYGSPNPTIHESGMRSPILRCSRALVNSTALQDVFRAIADALDTQKDDR